MGALDEIHFDSELENGVKLDSIEFGLEQQPEVIAIKSAVRVLLQGLGEDINREGIKKTPLRVAKALVDGTRGYKLKVKDIVQGALFPETGLNNGVVGQAGGVGGLVIVRDLDHFSYCESCLLPFQVKFHIGYVPSGNRVLGLSKFSRVADVFAKRLQDPHRLAHEVCLALHHSINPSGIAVILQCSHLQFPSQDTNFSDPNSKGWSNLVVSSGSGVFENENAEVWVDFLNLLKFRGVNISKSSKEKCWCPSQSSSRHKSPTEADPSMVTAVSSIIESLGENPFRKELVGTPTRFVKWLMNFKNTNLEINPKFNIEVSLGIQKHLHSEVNLTFWSQCEHHLLPFHGVVHIGYFHGDGLNPIGKSVLLPIVRFYGSKLQVQERLTRQIAETVSPLLGGDVIVVAEASHTCMISRGIEKFGSSTATIAVLGRFSTDSAARGLFLDSIPRNCLNDDSCS